MRTSSWLSWVTVQSYASMLLLAAVGVISDYATTVAGLCMGFHEANPNYSPLWSFLFFAWTIAILFVILPRKIRVLGSIGLAITPYLVAANNLMLIFGFVA